MTSYGQIATILRFKGGGTRKEKTMELNDILLARDNQYKIILVLNPNIVM